jgi:cobalt/nickel transport system permease protein
MLVITSVLAVQALLFQDGGLLALGANILNMAVIGVLLAWVVYTAVKRLFSSKTWDTTVGGFAAAWLSVVLASLVAAVELAISGASPWGVVLPAMVGVHALIGIGEGLITIAVLAFLRATRPDLLALRQATAKT